MQRDDQGQAVPLILMILGVALVAILIVAHRGEQVDNNARAQTAADAAALAGATNGEAAARTMAEANGAQLESFVVEGDRVLVVVAIDATVAMATAEQRREWARPP